MPTVEVTTKSTGRTVFDYVVSTPGQDSTESIDPSLPTVLFLHAVYLTSSIYHYQFADPKLRKFNLIAVDLKFHGKTTGDNPPATYNRHDAAEEIAGFMDALNLPPCHVVGLSLGTILGLQLAITYPSKVLSLFLMSPMGLREPEEVSQGRKEICEYWFEGYTTGDESMLGDAVYGVLQLAFSNKTSPLITSLVNITYPLSKTKWSPDYLGTLKIVTLDFLTKREEFSQDELAHIKVPVCLVHGLDDIPYPVEMTEEFRERLQAAGVISSYHKIANAPHCISIEPSREVNDIIHDFLLQNVKEPPPSLPADHVVLSPWDGELRENGWDPEDEEDDELTFI
ncbi:alpha/beta-hydrolase [Dendrothele bispora CBS 962.96]|uniref:Alpha/beta-hydrolase n=1 Tax=Dendrothele bispora (strain CBS 962.96) TaxID=1314807 RepID=A0A4S8LXT8_DENBC|nr:alpha/beta-hydrolase [Dendrothele bispora CBS 962.96]